VRLVRGNCVQVSDAFHLKEPTKSVVLSLMTPCEVANPEAGQLRLRDADTDTRVRVEYEPATLAAEVETIELDDLKLAEMWGPRLHRILLRADSPQAKGTWRLQFSAM
jgi:hypothetical protein